MSKKFDLSSVKILEFLGIKLSETHVKIYSRFQGEFLECSLKFLQDILLDLLENIRNFLISHFFKIEL